MSHQIQLHPSTLNTAEQFYAFFAMIPEDKWATGVQQSFDNPESRCARGHLNHTESGAAYGQSGASYRLSAILKCPESVINDGRDPSYKQPTPKARILAALKDKFSQPLP